jgi:8-oxo-dGTP pyrophosphatase MutT (NUDIX family)
MSRERRISAGGLIFKEESVLLVRYPDGQGGSYLVAPGGKAEDGENAVQTIVRETREETGLLVEPGRVLFIEDLETERIKMMKVWMLCDALAGEAQLTEGAHKEGIVQVGWYTPAQLANEQVYPEALMAHAGAAALGKPAQPGGAAVLCLLRPGSRQGVKKD